MKTFILIVILFITASQVKSQEAFVMGKTYPIDWIVWYPAYGTFYKATSAKPFIARATPDKDPTRWVRYTYTPAPNTDKPAPIPNTDPAPTTAAGYAKQTTVDSLLALLKVSQAKQDVVEAKANLLDAALNAMSGDVKVLKQVAATLKVSQTAIPLIEMGPDGVLQMRSIRVAPTSGLDAKVINGEIVIDKK